MDIAIFEKKDNYREPLAALLRQYWRGRGTECEIALYGDAPSLYGSVRTRSPSLVFLVLEQPLEESLAIARGLREICMDCALVFLTDAPVSLPELTPYRAMGCLAGLPDQLALRWLMGRFMVYHSRRVRQYTVHTRRSDHLVSHDSIRYFQSDGHYVSVHVEGLPEPLIHLRRLDDIQRELAALPYVRCHQSYLVNWQAVAAVESRWLRLKDDTLIPISRRYIPELALLSGLFGVG